MVKCIHADLRQLENGDCQTLLVHSVSAMAFCAGARSLNFAKRNPLSHTIYVGHSRSHVARKGFLVHLGPLSYQPCRCAFNPMLACLPDF
jgi:hypothetical protein